MRFSSEHSHYSVDTFWAPLDATFQADLSTLGLKNISPASALIIALPIHQPAVGWPRASYSHACLKQLLPPGKPDPYPVPTVRTLKDSHIPCTDENFLNSVFGLYSLLCEVK